MNSNSKLTAILITTVFLLIIFAVPITQGIVEIRERGSIQAFDIIVDATVTPFTTARKLNSLAHKQIAYTDSIYQELQAAKDSLWSREKTINYIDESIVLLDEIKKTARTKNRYVQVDSSQADPNPTDTLSVLLSSFMQSVQDELPVSEVSAGFSPIREKCAALTNTFPQESILHLPLMAIKNFRYILWNDTYIRKYEKDMEKASLFANAIRPQMNFAYYVLFRELGEKGVLGRNGWFFYKPDVDYLIKPYIFDPRSIVVDPNEKSLTDNPLKAIKQFKRQLDSLNIDLLVVIIPGKPSIYSDLLSSGISAGSAGKFSHSLRMIEDLRKEGVEAVDLFTPFANERIRDKEAGDSLYLREDTHWRARGLRLTAKIVGDRIKKYHWFQKGTTRYVIDSSTIDRVGDVGTMTTLPPARVSRFYNSFLPEKTKVFRVNKAVYDSTGALIDKTPFKDDFHNSEIIVLGDSFSRIYQTDEPRNAGWISHLACELSSPLCSIISDGGASTLVREKLARKKNVLRGKKLVVWEFIERDLRFGAEGWKDIKL